MVTSATRGSGRGSGRGRGAGRVSPPKRWGGRSRRYEISEEEDEQNSAQVEEPEQATHDKQQQQQPAAEKTIDWSSAEHSGEQDIDEEHWHWLPDMLERMSHEPGYFHKVDW